MQKETELDRLMSQGYQIMISEMVQQDTVFTFVDPANEGVHEKGDLLVFHPLNYSYLVYDPFEAHEKNMAWIQTNVIDRLSQEALDKIDSMMYEFEHKYDARVITFLSDVSVTENPDGSFTFFAHGGTEPAEFDKELAADFLKGFE